MPFAIWLPSAIAALPSAYPTAPAAAIAATGQKMAATVVPPALTVAPPVSIPPPAKAKGGIRPLGSLPFPGLLSVYPYKLTPPAYPIGSRVTNRPTAGS